MTASLHLGQVKSLDDFIAKAGWLQQNKPPHMRFTVTSVTNEDSFATLRDIERRLAEQQVDFRYQVRVDAGKFTQYPPEIEQYIQDRLAENISTLRDQDLKGTLCQTGQSFFVIRVDGGVTRCPMSQPGGYLGNIAQGTFRPFSRAMPCLSDRCTCEVPANRGMIQYGRRVNGVGLALAQCHAFWRMIPKSRPEIARFIGKRLGKT